MGATNVKIRLELIDLSCKVIVSISLLVIAILLATICAQGIDVSAAVRNEWMSSLEIHGEVSANAGTNTGRR
jgi:hypothetical protein